MVEVLIAMVVFSIVATAVAYGLQSALGITRQDRMRVQAAHLASREMELVRHEFSSSASGVADLAAQAVSTNPHAFSGADAPMKIDGVPFTLTRTVAWMPAGAGSSACDGGAGVTYPVLAVNVKVTWAKMGSTRPVESNTILTPPKDVVSGTTSFIAVKVNGADGKGKANVPVTLGGDATTQTRNTAADGCAVFSVSPSSYPKSYTATVSSPGFVDLTGSPTTSRSATVVSAGSLVRTTALSYDQAGTIVARMVLDHADQEDGFAPPQALPPFTLYNSGIVGSNQTLVVSSTGATTTISGLWPFTSGYESWPGTCTAAAAGKLPGVVVPPGGSVTVTHRLVPVEVAVTNSGAPMPNATVAAYPVSASGCSAAENPLMLGATDSDGSLKSSLITGSWQLQVVGAPAPTAGWPALTVTRTSPASLVNIQMGS